MGCLESLKVGSWLLCWGHQVVYDYVASIYIISSQDLILWLYLEDDFWILTSDTYLSGSVLTTDWVLCRVCQTKAIDCVSCIKIPASQYTCSNGFILIYSYNCNNLSLLVAIMCHLWIFYPYHTPCVPSVNLLSDFNII